jgi:SAM-dependent methyltransferase
MATAAELEARWAARVRADREQVERLRELDEGSDFYAPVAHTFVDDPDRMDDRVLDAILDLVQPADRWLDIGAGGGRYALPIARRARGVVAIDPSPRMRETLRAAATEFGIDNVTVVDGRWPMGEGAPTGDGALMAHVGYDIEHIGPFLDAAESAARRQLWVQPGSVKDERLSRAIAAMAMRSRGRLQLPGGPRRIGIVDWAS